MLVRWEENEPGLQTFWTDHGVVLECHVSVAYVGLNAVVLRCVTCSITYITGDLHIDQMSRLHDRTSRMQQVTE
jgi:hypothetical protein